MKAPFIVLDRGDIILFETVEHLTRYLEPPDIPSLRVFDASGQLVQLRPSPEMPAFGLEPTTIYVTPTGEYAEKGELEREIHFFLAKIGCPVRDDANMSQLIAALEARIGYTS